MGNIYDLKTVQKTLTGADAGTDLGIGAVPDGKTRHVVWMKLYAPSANMVSIGPSDGAAAALTSIKDKQGLGAGDTIAYPDSINMDTCLFSIQEKSFLGVVTTAGVTDTELTLVYFDA
ncbi:MAG: hypothetical protein J7K40_05975 [candidate division Zixibacteria bacterium]|nr:hypothetical protein [candidate division Zixibacteria bacterium]